MIKGWGRGGGLSGGVSFGVGRSWRQLKETQAESCKRGQWLSGYSRRALFKPPDHCVRLGFETCRGPWIFHWLLGAVSRHHDDDGGGDR